MTSQKMLSLEKRQELLQHLKTMLIEEESAIIKALYSDLRKSKMETYTSEIAVLLNEIDYVSSKLRKWMKKNQEYDFKISYVAKITRSRMPFGKVLIISPWNYPLQLSLMPAINAIAAGNSCIIKPSEHAVATSSLLAELIKRYFDANYLTVYLGDATVAKDLVASDIHFVFFTGSSAVGREVYEQSAAHLHPVVLELGGKNPCILGHSAFSEQSIQEIVWAKFLNAGQTCIAPNILYVPEMIYDKVITLLKKVITTFYGEHVEKSFDYARIIHEKHFKRLQSILTEGTVVHGGQFEGNSLFISPTIITDIPLDSSVFTEEIFGPILPVVPYRDLSSLLNSKQIQADALVGYIYTTSLEEQQLFRQYMKGTVSINKTIYHAGSSKVAFGGIGESGIGTYHGKAGFDTFTYEKTTYQAYNYMKLPQKYPPYVDKEFKIMKKLRKWLF